MLAFKVMIYLREVIVWQKQVCADLIPRNRMEQKAIKSSTLKRTRHPPF